MLVSASVSAGLCVNTCVCVSLSNHVLWPVWRSQLSNGRPRVARQAGTASHHYSTLSFTFSFMHFYRLLFLLYFSSRLSSFPCCHILLTCFLPLLFHSPAPLPPALSSFHIPLVSTLCTSSVRGQLTLKREDTRRWEINTLAYADKHTKCACSVHTRQTQMGTKSHTETLQLTQDRQWMHCQRLTGWGQSLWVWCPLSPIHYALSEYVSFDIEKKENINLFYIILIHQMFCADRADPSFWLNLKTSSKKKEFSQMYNIFESEVQLKVDCFLSELHKKSGNRQISQTIKEIS